MEFSENWLRSLVNPNITSEELSEILTMAGLEVENITPVAPFFSNVVVGKICKVKIHPNAEKLKICIVDVGLDNLLNIVCGASNVRKNILVPCALVGSKISKKNNSEIIEIKSLNFRGVASDGMLCSGEELGFIDSGEGLLELPDFSNVGENIRDLFDLDDKKFNLKLTPNRPDCLSILGIAREVSALTETQFEEPKIDQILPTIKEVLPVKILASDLCGRFSGRIIKGLNSKALTPIWMKQRLERSGQRSISALVDISNYVMLELGRPSHIFDLDKIDGGLEIRWGKNTERLKLLNGETVKLSDWVGVISDQSKVESLAGIMGGDSTAVSLDTKNIFLEAAFWWPKSIQGRSRKYNFSTDASFRFERGVDFSTNVLHIERITKLILEICGVKGETQIGPINDQIKTLPKRNQITLRKSRVTKIIGLEIESDKICNIFDRLGFKFIFEKDIFKVIPPNYRFDIEIEEDLIEEIARVYGFENIPAILPSKVNKIRNFKEQQRSIFDIKKQLAFLDYNEVINYSFVESRANKNLSYKEGQINLLNPISSQMSAMRTQLIGGLLSNLKYNLNRKQTRVRLFEIGSIFYKDMKVTDSEFSISGIQQVVHVAALAYGSNYIDQWGVKFKNVDFFDVKSDLELLFAPESTRFEPKSYSFLHPGRSASIFLNGVVLGFIGELHPKIQYDYELPYSPVIFEISLEHLRTRPFKKFEEISKFPYVKRDISLVVNQSIKVQEIIDVFYYEKKVNEICGIFQDIILFDEYRGKGLTKNEKSLAFRITMQDTKKTLLDDAVDTALRVFIKAVEKNCRAFLRN